MRACLSAKLNAVTISLSTSTKHAATPLPALLSFRQKIEAGTALFREALVKTCSHTTTRLVMCAVTDRTRSTVVIDEEDWKDLRGRYKTYDDNREKVIKKCRDMQKNSKNAIYSLHRGEFKRAAGQMLEVEKGMEQLHATLQESPGLHQGAYSNSLEEYAEAMILKTFLEEGKILPRSSFPRLSIEEYLGGLLDFTGELNRLAVAKATARDINSIRQYSDLVEQLVGLFIALDVRQPALRKKLPALDSTAWKLRNLLYELSLTECAPIRSLGAMEGPKGGREGDTGDEERGPDEGL